MNLYQYKVIFQMDIYFLVVIIHSVNFKKLFGKNFDFFLENFKKLVQNLIFQFNFHPKKFLHKN